MKALPKISVVTACFNSSRTIRETLRSVAEQNYPNLEHLLIDGGSSDGTIQILKETPHVIWTSEKDGGIYDAMNKGIRRATGDVIGTLNSDDSYRPNALLRVGEAFAAHPEWDALFGDIIYVDAEGREIYRRREAKYDYDVLRYSGVCYVSHPTLFVRKRTYDELGLYRHSEYLRAADYDFILQLGKHRKRVGHVREFLANFRFHEYSQSADLRVLASVARERERILAEHGVRPGLRGRLLRTATRAKRQLQKLFYRGAIDLRPGVSILKKHLHPEGKFSSNIPSETL